MAYDMSYLEQSRQAHLSMNNLRKEIEELEKQQRQAVGEMAKYYSGDYGDVSDHTNYEVCIYCGSDQGDKCKCTVTISHYGYGIVDRNGKPISSNVSGDKEAMQDVADSCNRSKEYRNTPYRVVLLVYIEE